MDLSNYNPATLSAPEAYISAAGEKWVLVYCASALTNGAIKELSYKVDTGTINPDATTAAPTIICIPIVPTATTGETTIIGVIDNSPLGLPSIAAGAYGYMKIQGVVQALCDGGTTDIAIADQLGISAASPLVFVVGTAASPAGTSGTMIATTFAIAMEAYTSGTAALKWVHLTGRQAVVGS
jgi:hypothetical protein